MHANEGLIRRFYEAFANKDYKTMQEAYHSQAGFSDPVFQSLSASEVRAMWKMLVTSASDLEINLNSAKADDNRGQCQWEALYTFSGTGRPVRNVIHATFCFRDGKILDHRDKFNFWRWSRMALGPTGLLLGWSPYLLHAVRMKARISLNKFMSNDGAKN